MDMYYVIRGEPHYSEIAGYVRMYSNTPSTCLGSPHLMIVIVLVLLRCTLLMCVH